MSSELPLAGNRPSFVVCGDNQLAYRLVFELVTRYDALVTVVLASRGRNHGPQFAELTGVRLVESSQPDEATLRDAGIADADALALVAGNDAETIGAALAAHELNPDVRLVIRMNPRLGALVRRLFEDCVVLSASQMAAPPFVAAALGDGAPNHIRLGGETLYTARRADVPERRVVCGLVDAADGGDAGVQLVPADQATESVLALADGGPRPMARLLRRSVFLRSIGHVLRHNLVRLVIVLLALVGLGCVLMATVGRAGWGDAVYQTLLDAAGDAQPDAKLRPFDKVVQLVVTFSGLALIPVMTAVVVSGLLRARLGEQGPDPARFDDHVVVVGLGNVGFRVLGQLHDLGVRVVAVELDENVRGVAEARRLGVPVVIGNATWVDILRSVSVSRARALLLMTSNDVMNLEVALLGRTYRDDLRVVLRLFDDDLAERVERRLGIAISRSVARLAAASFAAAMVERRVIGTMSVGRSALMIAEVPVERGSALVGLPILEAGLSGEAHVVAIQHGVDADFDWQPRAEYRLVAGDRLIVAATRAGLGRQLTRSIPPDTRAEPA